MTGCPNVVFLHGLCDDGAMWSYQENALAAEINSFAIDLVKQATVSECARYVLSKIPDRFSLVGFSMGGYVAFEIIRQAPERVDRLALISTSARSDTEERAAQRKALIKKACNDYDTTLDELLPPLLFQDSPNTPIVLKNIREMAYRIGSQSFVRQLQICMSRPDSRPDLPGIGCPVVVVCGKNDTVTPPDLAHEMADKIPNAKLVLIDDCGHYSSMEQERIVTSVLREWLARSLT